MTETYSMSSEELSKLVHKLESKVLKCEKLLMDGDTLVGKLQEELAAWRSGNMHIVWDKSSYCHKIEYYITDEYLKSAPDDLHVAARTITDRLLTYRESLSGSK